MADDILGFVGIVVFLGIIFAVGHYIGYEAGKERVLDRGNEWGLCWPNDTCNEGLVCHGNEKEAKRCIKPLDTQAEQE